MEFTQRISGHKNYIDYARMIGVFLVIIGHMNFCNESVKTWIYAIHMPVFFFISGLTIRSRDKIYKEKAGRYSLAKFRSIMRPYFLWALIYAAFSWKNLGYILYGSYTTIRRAESLSSLWFLPVLFLVHVLYELAIRVLKPLQEIAMWMLLLLTGIVIPHYLPALEMGYPFCFDIALCALGFVAAGALIRILFMDFIQAKIKCPYIIWTFLVVVFAFFVRCLVPLNPVHRYVLMAAGRYGKYSVFWLTAIAGCLMVVSAAKLLEWLPIPKRIQKFLVFVGSESLLFFVIQKPVIALAEQFWKAFPYVCPTFVVAAVSFGAVLTIGSVLVWLIARYFPCLK